MKNITLPPWKLSFHLPHLRILGSMECGETINYCLHGNASKNNIKLNISCIKIQQNNWYINTESTLWWK